MTNLLRKPTETHVSNGVRMLHEVTALNSPLRYVAFKVLDIDPESTYAERLHQQECCIVVLSGKVHVRVDDAAFHQLGTRTSVFERKPTDSVYVSKDHQISIEGDTSARVALCYAPSRESRPTRVIRASENHVELRGILNNRRLVHNILADSDQHADSLLVVEVFTEGGNWSSYPPHKHDRDCLPEESLLEETYYHEIHPHRGFVVQRVYTDDGSIDETMSVTDGDVVLVPKGYHPVGVPDGYSSYYLNVMAGPKRIWKFYNDPAHEWILQRPSE